MAPEKEVEDVLEEQRNEGNLPDNPEEQEKMMNQTLHKILLEETHNGVEEMLLEEKDFGN
jgi:hypothetical protein